MTRPLELLAVSGFRISLHDNSDFWKLIDACGDVPNVCLTERTWDACEDEVLSGKDAVICYSWGVATVFKAIARLRAAGRMPKIPVLIIMAGVPRGLVQCIEVSVGGGWVVPEEVTEAVCLQVNSVPVSYPIKNSGPNRLNVLIKGIPGNDHVGLENFSQAHDLILQVITAEAQALAENQLTTL